jgi:hypothetical protein
MKTRFVRSGKKIGPRSQLEFSISMARCVGFVPHTDVTDSELPLPSNDSQICFPRSQRIGDDRDRTEAHSGGGNHWIKQKSKGRKQNIRESSLATARACRRSSGSETCPYGLRQSQLLRGDFTLRNAHGMCLTVFNYDQKEPQTIAVPVARIDPSLATATSTSATDVVTGTALEPAHGTVKVELSPAESNLLLLH